MPEDPAAAPAQDNTAPAAAAPAAPAPAPAPAAPPAQQPPPAPAAPAPAAAPAQEAPAPAPEAGNPPGGIEMLLGGDGEGGAPAAPAAPGDGYELAFPENTVADAEAVAVLNAVGKEFGVTGEKAQALADAATAYGNRRVDAVLKAGRKGYEDFVAAEAKKTKEYYGPEYKARLTEAAAGLAKLLPEGVGIDDLRRDPNFQAITNVWWFAEMGRKYNRFVSEQPSITGEPERPKVQDLYSKYD